MNVHRELHRGLDACPPARVQFIHKAFRMLPRLEQPRILDVGCGRGGPTLELARLSGGRVLGVDTDAEVLQELMARAAAEGLAGQITCAQISMSALDFANGSFDVIWAEASIHIMGFEAGLEAWRRFLVAGGFLVIHEMAWLQPDPPPELADLWRGIIPGIRTVPEYVAAAARQRYRLVGSFLLPEDFWWEHYFRPLERRITDLSERYRGNQEALESLRREQRNISIHRKNRSWYGSAYLLMQRMPD